MIALLLREPRCSPWRSLCLAASARSPNPLLDLALPARAAVHRRPNFAAFCTYFATFAIFFFTALYLVEVDGRRPATGWRWCSLPMTVLMIISSLTRRYGGPVLRRAALVYYHRLPAVRRRAC